MLAKAAEEKQQEEEQQNAQRERSEEGGDASGGGSEKQPGAEESKGEGGAEPLQEEKQSGRGKEDDAGDTADEASARRKWLHTESYAHAPEARSLGCQHRWPRHSLQLLGQRIAAPREVQGEDQRADEHPPAAAGEGRGLLLVEHVQQRAQQGEEEG